MLSSSVNRTGDDAGRELLDHLHSISPNPRMTPQDVEMMKRFLKAKFSDESLMIGFHKIRQMQQRPTLEQYCHFMINFEGENNIKKSLDELIAENMNLRMDKDGYMRCFQVLREQIVTRNAQLSTCSTEKEQLAREKEQLAREKEQIARDKEQLANENLMLKAQMVQMGNRAESQRSE
ncbi:unnamed protein product [Mytilus coruscus]|uniref:Uncharacterized protein n=1 Tax=Mytilus coruscus TaxID=42192 RepID=A0A6J7ZWK5_MYTCO|nr:unnamed protein product [Mytilus coruscus]